MSESTMKIKQDGTKIWENEAGELHRLDGPAVEWADGTLEWWVNGLLHRDDGPAMEYTDGTKFWYQYGLIYRLDGPAIEWVSGKVSWYINGHYLGNDIKGFWKLWDRLDEEQRQNVNLHTCLTRLTKS